MPVLGHVAVCKVPLGHMWPGASVSDCTSGQHWLAGSPWLGACAKSSSRRKTWEAARPLSCGSRPHTGLRAAEAGQWHSEAECVLRHLPASGGFLAIRGVP